MRTTFALLAQRDHKAKLGRMEPLAPRAPQVPKVFPVPPLPSQLPPTVGVASVQQGPEVPLVPVVLLGPRVGQEKRDPVGDMGKQAPRVTAVPLADLAKPGSLGTLALQGLRATMPEEGP